MIQYSPEEELRYSRQINIPGFGRDGQERLRQARVLIIGAGGLGSPNALYLAAAGVGTLAIADDDVVELNNLQRQILHGTAYINQLKVVSARETLYQINPLINIVIIPERITAVNARQFIADFDLVIDGTDNFDTRYIINDYCFWLQKPFVHGSVFKYSGQVSLFNTQQGPCYRCLYPLAATTELLPSYEEKGVLGIIPGVIGTIQATEAIKFICSIGEALIGRLLLYDACKMHFRTISFDKSPDCPLCGENPSIQMPAI